MKRTLILLVVLLSAMVLQAAPSAGAGGDTAAGDVSIDLTVTSARSAQFPSTYVISWSARSKMFGFQQGSLDIRQVVSRDGSVIRNTHRGCTASTYCYGRTESGAFRSADRYVPVCVRATGTLWLGPREVQVRKRVCSSGVAPAVAGSRVQTTAPAGDVGAAARVPTFCGDNIGIIWYPKRDRRKPFKVYGVELRDWLPGANGLLRVAYADRRGIHDGEYFNASRHGGAVSRVFEARGNRGDVTVSGELYDDDKHFLCSFVFSW